MVHSKCYVVLAITITNIVSMLSLILIITKTTLKTITSFVYSSQLRDKTTYSNK